MKKSIPKGLIAVLELFRAPSNEYRSVPFWSWNCRVTRALIDADLDTFVRMGFGGVCIHPRAGLDVEYLGDEFMDLVEYAVHECERRGLICWLYDDDRFPSGAADGLVTKVGQHRGTYLLMSEDRRDGFAAAWELELSGERLVSCRRLADNADVDAALSRRSDTRRVRFGYIEYLPASPLFEGSSYIDTTDPAAVRAFIDITHERYFSRIGKYFGSTVQAVFTDEPRMEPRLPRSMGFSGALSGSDFAVPFTPASSARFRAQTGLDPLDIMPELIWERPGGEYLCRQYREALAESFASAYMDQLGAWCREHNIMSTGHILGEETLTSQTLTVGEAARCCRSMDLPGYDILIDERNYAAAIQVRSVAALMGKSGVMCELYGSTGWECDFLTYKLQGDRAAALGTTHRVPHLAHMSLEGEAKRDWPASISAQSPWWERFRLLEDHFARLNTVLRRGKRLTRVAVISPLESVWVHPMAGTGAERSRREKSSRFDALITLLLGALIDFDLISESLLASGQMDICGFEAVVVPDSRYLRPSTSRALDAFSGDIILPGPDLLDRLEKYRDVSVAGSCPGGLLYELREDGARRWLFLAHTGLSSASETLDITLRGAYSPCLWDTLTGGVSPLPADIRDGNTHITRRVNPEDSLLIELTPVSGGADDRQALPVPAPGVTLVPSGPLSVALSEPNVLLLDRASASLDGGPASPPTQILRLDNDLRARLGLPPRCEEMRQPWATAPGSSHSLTLTYAFFSELPTRSAVLALERPEEQEVRLNGLPAAPAEGYFIDRSFRLLALPEIRPGENVLTLRRAFDARTNLEPIYLLGGFSVLDGRLAPPRPIALGDIVPQGLPHYTGNLTYEFTAIVERPGTYSLRLPSFAAPLADVSVDGSALRPVLSSAPVDVGHLRRGEHWVLVTLYGSRYNLLGALHNADASNPWRGPDSWRTEGTSWSDDYILRPCGLLAPPELILTSPDPE